MKKIIVIFLIALVHLGVSKTVVAITLAGTSGNAFNGEMSMWVKMLIWITKVLYFPIITLSLYSRQWFPGKLIYHTHFYEQSAVGDSDLFYGSLFLENIETLIDRKQTGRNVLSVQFFEF